MRNPQQLRWLADKLADLANLAAGALIFGQFTGGQFNFAITAFGLAFVLGLYFYSNIIIKRT